MLNTSKIPSPYEQFLPLPIHPLLNCFRRDSVMTHHCPASYIFHCCPPAHPPPQSPPPPPPPKKRIDCTRTRNFPSCPCFSNLEYYYHVSLRNSLLNGDNLEYDKPTIRKIQSNRFYVYYKKP